jgi:ELWxxDGT repeat protein
MRQPGFLVFLALVLGLGLAGSARPASGVEAEDTGVTGRLLSLGRVALVPVAEPETGNELWVSNGTDAGTRLLLDFCPGPCSSEIDLLGAIGRVGIFLANFHGGQPVLWRSDGTLPGTFVLARFADGGPERCSLIEPPKAAVAGSTLFFSGRTEGGCELWKTDGTVAGTRRLRKITPADLGSHVLHEMTAVGRQVFFMGAGFEGAGLWRSDGTPEGTVRLRAWRTSEPRSLVAVGSRIFFVADRQGREVWTSDGTRAGTRALTSFAPADSGLVLRETGGRLYFLANDGTNGREMWSTDGTAAGTRRVTRFANANPFGDVWRVEKLGERLVFPANDGLSGLRLWTTDGRPESTAPVDRCSGGCPNLAPDLEMVRVGSKIFFPAVSNPGCLPDGPPSTDLWVSDGTGAGTRRVHDYCPCCRVTRLTPLLGKVFFAAGEHFASYDLWASDGTNRGTRLLVPVEGFNFEILPYPPVVVRGRGLLAQREGIADLPQLWVTDGTPAGTDEVLLSPE